MVSELKMSTIDKLWHFFWKATELGKTDIAKAAFLTGLDINYQDQKGRTPLMVAVLHNRKELVTYLLTKYVDITLCDYQNKNALEMALELGHEEISQLLLSYLANY